MNKLLSGKFTLAAFFYTRFDNPAKYSLIISNLASIQAILLEAGFMDRVNTIAITYDLFYDKPDYLSSNRNSRGWTGITAGGCFASPQIFQT
jgi:cytochrome oxidase Cu insertion factor (SCO1/SenC/PrrC family)